MKLFATITAVAMTLSGAAVAQTTTQAAVLGASGDAVYSLQVQGANGVIYNCKPQPVEVDGNTARVCVRDDDEGGLFAAGAGMKNGAAAAGAALVLIGLAAGGSSSSTTTTTND